MARTHVVAKARKDQGNCRGCGTAIKAGDPYKWAHPRYRGKVKVCAKCQITPSMTSSSKMVAVWDAQEAVSKADTVEDIAQALHDLAETAREVGGEYREAAENQQQYFPDSEIAAENEQKADDLESWADDVEGAADEVDNIVGEEVEAPELEREEGEPDEDFEDRIEEAKQEAEDEATETAVEEAQQHASIADDCPC